MPSRGAIQAQPVRGQGRGICLSRVGALNLGILHSNILSTVNGPITPVLNNIPPMFNWVWRLCRDWNRG